MNTQRARLRPLHIPQRKQCVFDPSPDLIGGSLTPDLQPSTPPSLPDKEPKPICEIGRYILLEQKEVTGKVEVQRAIHRDTQEEFICKVVPLDTYRQSMAAYWRTACIEGQHVSQVEEILLGQTKAYAFFKNHYGDLHTYVRSKRKLREGEAGRLFRQIMLAVQACHERGIILRDLKLRKFVCVDEERTELRLDGLEDACVLDDDNDILSDKHGCPAYVSPEILTTKQQYSGRAADMWSAGVMLYTLLIGRYPFHDAQPGNLFSKIRRGAYSVPEGVSSRAKCLIRCVLRLDPCQRLTASQVLVHPWLRPNESSNRHKGVPRDQDQSVPSFTLEEEPSFFT